MDKATNLKYNRAHYGAMAKVWWNEVPGLRILYNMNELRIPYIQEKVMGHFNLRANDGKQPLDGVQILDAGCGGGYMSEELAKLGANVTGLDITEEVIDVAKWHADKMNLNDKLTYTTASIEEYAVSHRASFDVVACSEVIEHVDNVDNFVKSCIDCTKPGGAVVITTINRTWFAYFLMIVIMEYVLGIIKMGTFFYRMFVTPDELRAICKKYGCEVVDVKGFIANPLTGRSSWWPSTSVLYVFYARKYDN